MTAFFVRVQLCLILSVVATSLLASTAWAGPANLGVVKPGIYRGGTLNRADDFQQLANLGVKTIINLEFAHKDEAKYCRQFGFECKRYGIFNSPWRDWGFNYERLVQAFKATLAAHNEGKTVYIHCKMGSDRTGALASAIMIRDVVCENPDYDKGALKTLIETTLQKYNFHTSLFPQLRQKILNWTQNPPEWICQ